MEPIKGIKLKDFSLKDDLHGVADLIYFDGPLLSQFRNSNGDIYLFYWCDVDSHCNRWLVFRVGTKSLDQYLSKKISLRQLIRNPMDGLLYVTDIDDDLNYHNTLILEPDILPSSYIPEQDVFYDHEPIYFGSEIDQPGQGNYKILLDNEWSLRDLYEFPKNYSQVYSFLYALQTAQRDPHQLESLQHIYNAYPWKGGYSALNFYKAVNTLIAPEHKPEIASIHYSSPGWIELDLYLPAAFSIQRVVLAVIKSGKDLRFLSRSIHQGLKLFHLSQVNVKTVESELNEEQIHFVAESVDKLSKLLNFEYIDQLKVITNNQLLVLKILLSFYKRAKKLAQYQIDGKASYV